MKGVVCYKRPWWDDWEILGDDDWHQSTLEEACWIGAQGYWWKMSDPRTYEIIARSRREAAPC